jgi:hypothetical protein
MSVYCNDRVHGNGNDQSNGQSNDHGNDHGNGHEKFLN